MKIINADILDVSIDDKRTLKNYEKWKTTRAKKGLSDDLIYYPAKKCMDAYLQRERQYVFYLENGNYDFNIGNTYTCDLKF